MDTSIYPFVLLTIYDAEINYHYLKRYIKFIRHFKAIEPHGKRKKGFERHHIFPNNRCSSRFSKDANNLVLLPAKAHFVAHHLLYKAFPKNQAMVYAFKRLTENKKYKSRITGKMFEKLRNDFIEIQRANALKRVEDGTNPFLDREIARANALKRVEEGTHNLLGGKLQRARVENGTHNFLDSDFQRENALKRVEEGTHHFLGGKIQRATARASNLKRLKNGTHNFLETGKVSVFDLDLGKCVRIPKEDYRANRERFLHPSSKKYKSLKKQIEN